MVWVILYLMIAYGFYLDQPGIVNIRMRRKGLPEIPVAESKLNRALVSLVWPCAIGSLLSQINLYMDRYEND